MTEKEIIIGLHSIAEAIKNPQRYNLNLYATAKGLKELKEIKKLTSEQLNKVTLHQLDSQAFQKVAEKTFRDQDFQFSRIPSQIFLEASPLVIRETDWLLDLVKKKSKIKIFALDQVTDVHNGAAILRTAAFYNVDAVILPLKKSFGLSPQFYRIASGATEHVHIVRTSHLSRMIQLLHQNNVRCLGFTEDGEEDPLNSHRLMEQSTCLVLGAEDVGISHAVKRVLAQKIYLKSLGNISTLNVSVASAIAMERYFHTN